MAFADLLRGSKKPAEPLTVTGGYMYAAYEGTDHLVGMARERFQDAKVAPDTLVGTGLSGSLVVPLLARNLGMHWLIVRKPNDGSHSVRIAEGKLGASYVLVDDFTSSGRTCARMIHAVDKITRDHDHPAELLGGFFYSYDEWYPADRLRLYAKSHSAASVLEHP